MFPQEKEMHKEQSYQFVSANRVLHPYHWRNIWSLNESSKMPSVYRWLQCYISNLWCHMQCFWKIIMETSQIVRLVRKKELEKKKSLVTYENLGQLNIISLGLHEFRKISPCYHQLHLSVILLWRLKVSWSQRSNLTNRAFFKNVFKNIIYWADAEYCSQTKNVTWYEWNSRKLIVEATGCHIFRNKTKFNSKWQHGQNAIE